MTDKLDSTDRRLKLILIVERLAKNDPRGLASHASIVDTVMQNHEATKTASKVLLNRCYRQGWLERPFRGLYRLTVKAYETLKEMGVDV